MNEIEPTNGWHPADGVTQAVVRRPTISVVVAVYNGVQSIAACLESVIGQSYPHKEIVVIDGGSTDGTVDLIRQRSDALTYWVSEPDRGIAHAWNKGLEASSADWVIFLGADDRFANDKVLADIAPLLEANPSADIVYGSIRFEGGPNDAQGVGERYDDRKFRYRMTIPHGAAFIRKGVYAEVGNYDERYRIAMDYELLLRKLPLNAVYWNRLVTVMGGYGVSSKMVSRSLKESLRAQLSHESANAILLRIRYGIYVLRHSVRRLISGSFRLFSGSSSVGRCEGIGMESLDARCRPVPADPWSA